jgi:hypothetical protein
VSLNKNKFDVVELREQRLVVTVCSALNETWYIKDDGLFTGYIASGDELLEVEKCKSNCTFAVSNHSAGVAAARLHASNGQIGSIR